MDLSDTTEVVCFRFSSYLNRSLFWPLWRLPSGKQNFIACSQQIFFSLVDPLPSPPSLHSRQRYRIHRTPFSTSTPTHGNFKRNNNCNNPQSNSAIERMHLSFGQILRAILAQAKLCNNEQHTDILNSYIESALSFSLYAINCAVNSTTKVSPGAFIFQLDMLLPIQCITNWEIICQKSSSVSIATTSRKTYAVVLLRTLQIWRWWCTIRLGSSYQPTARVLSNPMVTRSVNQVG